MSFDLARALQRVRPQRRSAPTARPGSDIDLDARRPEILLDTCVYIDVAKDRTNATLDALLARRLIRHSSVALAELTHLFERLDPAHPGTASTLRELTAIVADIPERRLSAPSLQAFGEAGMLTGLAARLSGKPHGQAALNDALLHLQAAEGGWMLVTRNAGNFGLLRRLSPRTEVFLY